MATQITKNELFDNFFTTTVEVFSLLEDAFNLPSSYITEQNFNTNNASEKVSSAEKRLEQSDAWQTVSKLYDYAINGIISDGGYTDIEDAATELVIGGAEIISLITTENNEPHEAWDKIIMMGDGRFSLDTGNDIGIMKLALLADVDIRTVRNAVSSGELSSTKVDNVVFINNRSAQLWLINRRAFKPTKFITSLKKDFGSINNGIELGAYLAMKRENLGLELPKQEIHAKKCSIQPTDIAQLESGVFNLPLYSIDLLADFYEVPSEELLDVIMTVYFPEYLRQILERNSSK